MGEERRQPPPSVQHLQRLALTYQLISKDEALKALLSSRSSASIGCCGDGADCCGSYSERRASGGVCFCASRLLKEAAADVAALRSFLLRSGERPAATEEPRASLAFGEREALAATGGGKALRSSRDSAVTLYYDPATGSVLRPPFSSCSPPSPSSAGAGGAASSQVRIYVDGVFDLLHSGHFNALRQARLLGSRLVVGINSDAETREAKGVLPIYTQDERAEIVASCKWVDEVVVGTPYEVSCSLLDALACDFAAHGDDWVVGKGGVDAYAEPRAAGRMKVFLRTEGPSSTSIARRLLAATAHLSEERVKLQLDPQPVEEFAAAAAAAAAAVGEEELREASSRREKTRHSRGRRAETAGDVRETQQQPSEEERPTEGGGAASSATGRRAAKEFVAGGSRGSAASSHCCSTAGSRSSSGEKGSAQSEHSSDRRMLMSSKRLLQFIEHSKKPKPGDRVVYVDGSFDVFHVGHVRILKKAKQLGDYLIVGIHAMRMVDEVIIGAPWVVPHYLLQMFRIDVVVRGARVDCVAVPWKSAGGETPAAAAFEESLEHSFASSGPSEKSVLHQEDPYAVPKAMGIYCEVESDSAWTTKELLRRVVSNKQALSNSILKRWVLRKVEGGANLSAQRKERMRLLLESGLLLSLNSRSNLRLRETRENHFWQSLAQQTSRVAAEL